jgi:hypothetical protein
VLRVQSA